MVLVNYQVESATSTINSAITDNHIFKNPFGKTKLIPIMEYVCSL